jgi:hypothetical protein
MKFSLILAIYQDLRTSIKFNKNFYQYLIWMWGTIKHDCFEKKCYKNLCPFWKSLNFDRFSWNNLGCKPPHLNLWVLNDEICQSCYFIIGRYNLTLKQECGLTFWQATFTRKQIYCRGRIRIFLVTQRKLT